MVKVQVLEQIMLTSVGDFALTAFVQIGVVPKHRLKFRINQTT
jgi:hypothetical protein